MISHLAKCEIIGTSRVVEQEGIVVFWERRCRLLGSSAQGGILWVADRVITVERAIVNG